MLAVNANRRVKQFRKRDVNAAIALVVSFMLSGVPPIVCETVLEEVVTTLKKKIGTI